MALSGLLKTSQILPNPLKYSPLKSSQILSSLVLSSQVLSNPPKSSQILLRCATKHLGSLYALLAKRRGRVVGEDIIEARGGGCLLLVPNGRGGFG